MKLLLVVPAYPYAAHPYSGVFNQRCAAVLGEICEHVEVLSPRPYSSRLLGWFNPRWKAYTQIPRYQEDGAISVYRPPYLQIPGGASFWTERAAFMACRRLATARHKRVCFDAILSFDLIGAGPLALRLGRLLRLPAAGWATGCDVRVAASSPEGRLVREALRSLDLVFYQSRELLGVAASLRGTERPRMSEMRNIVLPRGIVRPPPLSKAELRQRIRSEWGIGGDDLVVLTVGRITRAKGAFELLDAFAAARRSNPHLVCVFLGAQPGFDESAAVGRALEREGGPGESVRILPACRPSQVWEYLCAADIFAFTSHNEGMPNSLLEAMAMEVPAVAFGIPAVLEIQAGTDAPLTVPPLDVRALTDALLALANSPSERNRLGRLGKWRVEADYMITRNMELAVRHMAGMTAEPAQAKSLERADRFRI